MSEQRKSVLVRSVVILLLALVPEIASALNGEFFIAFGARALIYAIAAVSLNIALGFGGMVSLGHALFIGLGMYSVALSAHFGTDNGWIHLMLALLSCAMVGAVTGWISLRTTGIAFIMITLAFAQMGYFVFVSLKQFGGDDGMAVAQPSAFFGVALNSPRSVYFCTLLCLFLVLIWIEKLKSSPFGFVLRACRQSERRVASLGINPRHYMLTGYVISAMLCGISGVLLANLNAYVSPGSMSWMVSGELIVMVILGGIGTVTGPVMGALIYLFSEEALKSITDSWMAIFGLLILSFSLLGNLERIRSSLHGYFKTLMQRGTH